MCGVFGFVSSNGRGPDIYRLHEIAAVTETRGRDAFGLAWQDASGGIGHFKRPGAATKRLADLRHCEDAVMLVGHCRFATHGSPAKNTNNHPHLAGRGYLVHNGVVRNYKSLADRHDLELTTECDTEVIARMIAKVPGSVLRRSAWAAEQAEGDLATLGLWKDRLVIVRNGKPLHFGLAEEGWYFASLAGGLPDGKMLRNAHACQLKIAAGAVTITTTELQPRLAL